MGRLIDLTGKRFGRLTVIERHGTKIRGINNTVKTPTWRCVCDCGNEKIVTSAELRSGDTHSCGCLAVELLTAKSTTHGDGHKGAKYYRLYRIWFKMKERCEKPNDKAFHYYGARGISVCDEWHDYLTFKDWALSNGYSDDLTIDRIDVNGNYCPENCRWANYKVQANNKRSCRYIEIDGEIKTIAEWCDCYNTNYFTALSRIDLFGWNPEKAVSYRPAKKHFYQNVQEVD